MTLCSLVYGYLQFGIGVPTVWYMGTYSLVYGYLRFGIWVPTVWYMGTYSLVYGYLKFGIWVPTVWWKSLPPSSKYKSVLNMKAGGSSKMFTRTYQTT